MRVAMIGVGRLGCPVSVAMAEKGHHVIGYDINHEIIENYQLGKTNLYEPDIDQKLQKQLDEGNISFTENLEEAVKKSKIVFIAVQTPHPEQLDGSVRFNHARKDFDYSFLLKSCCDIAKIVDKCDEYKLIVIISTVLPGTTEELIYPEMQKYIKPIGHNWSLIYSPLFIAMGTTVRDFMNPEFTLVGEHQRQSEAGNIIERFYNTIHDKPIMRMKWAEAEGTKVWYNTFITFKITYANMIMQLCDKLNANCDVVANALTKATDRLISSKYLFAGNQDGGHCHPRDNMALAYISEKYGLDYNLFDFIMTVREKQIEWFADNIQKYMQSPDQQVVIMGKTFKPFTNLVGGSPSILLFNILQERGIEAVFYDPETNPIKPDHRPSIFFIGTNWPEFKVFDYPANSIVIDVWGMIKDVPSDVKLISLGRK